MTNIYKFFYFLASLFAEKDLKYRLTLFLEKNLKIIAAIKFKKCVISKSIFNIIISKFSY